MSVANGFVVPPNEEPEPIAAATPAPVVRELAPAGIVYLLVRTRVQTDSGIISLPPGTGLKLVRPGVYTDGIRELPLSADAVTNDVETARAAKREDAAKEVVIAPRAATPKTEPKPRTPAVRAMPGAHASGALGVSNGLDMDRTNKLGHK